MKRILIVLLLSTYFSMSSQETKEIFWNDNIEKGIEMGAKQNKEVLIYFGQEKCVPCRMIDKYAFKKTEFIDYSKKYVMVKVYDDFNKSNIENQEYVKKSRAKYGIKSVPTIVLLKKNGTKSSFFAYIKTPQQLIEKIEALY